MNEWGESTGEMMLTGEVELLRETSVTVLFHHHVREHVERTGIEPRPPLQEAND